jgi:hypothetical protein
MSDIKFNGDVVVLRPGDSLLCRLCVPSLLSSLDAVHMVSDKIEHALPGIPFLIVVGDEVRFSVLRRGEEVVYEPSSDC